MNSSISSSDPVPTAAALPGAAIANGVRPTWRATARGCVLWAGGLLLTVYGFVCVIDPWDVLPLSPSLPRVPISTNSRFSFPALARSARFDSIVLGTSTARLLRPKALDAAFGNAHFANLAMNSATAWEQLRMLGVFRASHAHPRTVVIGLDAEWCGRGTLVRYTPRPFPEWMYEPTTWRGYLEVLNLYALQEAANQFAVMVGLKRRRYGLDGYTNFLPPESQYDPVRVAAAFARWGPPDEQPLPDPPPDAAAPPPVFPAHALLREALLTLPSETRTVLFWAPYHSGRHGAPNSGTARAWAACKAGVTRAVTGTGAVIADFMRTSAITQDTSNYWDPLHYRVPIADRVVQGLNAALDGQENPDFALLTPPSRHGAEAAATRPQ